MDKFLSQSKGIGADSSDKKFDTIDKFRQSLLEESTNKLDNKQTCFIGNANILFRANLKHGKLHIFQMKDYHCAQTLMEEIHQLHELEENNDERK